MDVIGSEIGQKMRSAIKAKLTEIGCYVDDELPDYVMVMVANKRTREQMEDDLQLFLATNTEPFVHWLHQVLTRLQEVTINTPVPTISDPTSTKSDKKISSDSDKSFSGKKEKSRSGKRHKEKSKEKHKKSKKEKKNKDGVKKTKSHKSKKKDTDIIELNLPPLLMNIEKESEPSITDVFAGQILKNHGYQMMNSTNEKSDVPETKPPIATPLKTRFPIIDPETVTSPGLEDVSAVETETQIIPRTEVEQMALTLAQQPREEQIREMNEIETKIVGLKKKLAEQMDSLSEDEDFLNIRTEAEELMGCDLLGETLLPLREQIVTPPMNKPESTTTTTKEVLLRRTIRGPSPDTNVPSHNPTQRETLPQIELNLPKRPLRERISARPAINMVTPMPKNRDNQKNFMEDVRKSPERQDSDQHMSLKSRLGERHKSSRPGTGMSSVVLVRPRPRAAASSLLMRAVADANRSLLNIPPKIEMDSSCVKKALVLPVQRSNAKNIVIEVNSDKVPGRSMSPDDDYPHQQSQYVPSALAQRPMAHYTPTRRRLHPEPDAIATIINSKKNNEESGPRFVVTLDGLDPNMFLNKKLENEGIETVQIKREKPDDANDSEETKTRVASADTDESNSKVTSANQSNETEKKTPKKLKIDTQKCDEDKTRPKTIESDVKVIEKTPVKDPEQCNEGVSSTSDKVDKSATPLRKRRGSPIVFDVNDDKKNKPSRDRSKEQAQVATPKKYEAGIPTLGACRSFPSCVFGSACAFTHPPCRWGVACTRRACPYSHDATPTSAPAAPVLASRVVPVSNYVGIKSVAAVCRFYPSCSNPACAFLHPKPCRYGGACLNAGACNFYHAPNPALKWRSGTGA